MLTLTLSSLRQLFQNMLKKKGMQRAPSIIYLESPKSNFFNGKVSEYSCPFYNYLYFYWINNHAETENQLFCRSFSSILTVDFIIFRVRRGTLDSHSGERKKVNRKGNVVQNTATRSLDQPGNCQAKGQ